MVGCGIHPRGLSMGPTMNIQLGALGQSDLIWVALLPFDANLEGYHVGVTLDAVAVVNIVVRQRGPSSKRHLVGANLAAAAQSLAVCPRHSLLAAEGRPNLGKVLVQVCLGLGKRQRSAHRNCGGSSGRATAIASLLFHNIIT